MPPARKTYPYQGVAETHGKRPFPRHIINIQDLLRENEDDKTKGHLVVNIDQFSPENISIRRSGDKLTVETKREDKTLQGGPGAEHVTRSYQIPAGGFTPEFGSRLSADGLLSVGDEETSEPPECVIPIKIDLLKQMKPGTVIKLNPADWQTEFPLKFSPHVVSPIVDHKKDARAESTGASREQEEMMTEDEEEKGAGDRDDSPEPSLSVTLSLVDSE